MSSKTEQDNEFFRALAEYAGLVNRRRRTAWIIRLPTYDIMSGGLVWPDEYRFWWPAKLTSALRILWAYRTSNMLGKPQTDCRPYWDFGLEHFPRWVGFRQDRQVATAMRLRLLIRGQESTQKLIREIKHSTGLSEEIAIGSAKEV